MSIRIPLKYYLFVFSLLVCLVSSSQSEDQTQRTVDSLAQLAEQTHDNNQKIIYLTEAGKYYINNQPDKANKYLKSAEQLLTTDTPDSIRYNLIVRIANAYEKMQSQSKQSAQYYNNALKIAEHLQDSAAISTVYFQLGTLNFYQGDMKLAERYMKKAYSSVPSYEDPVIKSNLISALGVIYTNNKDYEKADSAIHIARRIALANNNIRKSAVATSNLAEIKWELGQKDSALSYLNEAIQMNREINFEMGIAWCSYLKGSFEMDLKNWSGANESMSKAIAIWEKLESRKDLAYGYEKYAKIKAQINDYEAAYKINLKLQEVKDSIFKKENIEHIQELEKKYESEKDSIAIANMEVQLQQEKELNKISQKKNELEKKARTRLIIFFIIIGVLLIINAVYFYYRLQSTQRAKSTIEFQKTILEEKNREITDSITYAKRIQNAIIPGTKKFKSFFPASFIFYEPKDIVAGDFYWAEEIDGYRFCAVADCTGHGVPGAMVSVVCANALNKAILEEKILEPGKALNRVREIVKSYFNQNDDDIKDGMDISMIRIHKDLSAASPVLFAGANNPIWIISPGQTQENPYKLTEVKGDKQPIGKYEQEKPFTTHTLEVSAGDRLYLFTDGFSDQFGGDKGKKLKISNFRSIILDLQPTAIEQQENLLLTSFDRWKGDLEQLDDVCIIGIQI